MIENRPFWMTPQEGMKLGKDQYTWPQEPFIDRKIVEYSQNQGYNLFQSSFHSNPCKQFIVHYLYVHDTKPNLCLKINNGNWQCHFNIFLNILSILGSNIIMPW